MSFNFHHDHADQTCPINWAITVPVRVTVDPIPLAQPPRNLSTQELAALIQELGREGSLNPLQIKVMTQLPELVTTIAAE